MTQTLWHCHDGIRIGLREMRQHCSAASPDMAALTATRHRQSRNFTRNSRHIYDVLIPRCRAQADAAQGRALDEAVRQMNAKRFAISAHIAKWGSREISDNWSEYRTIALEICDLVDEQLRIERDCFSRFEPIDAALPRHDIGHDRGAADR